MAAVSHDHSMIQSSCHSGISYRSPPLRPHCLLYSLQHHHHHHQQQQQQQESRVSMTGPSAPATNSTSESSGGDYPVTCQELISSPHSCYQVLELLGRGTFGQVLRCWKKDSNEVVAVKILKNLPSYTKQGQVEVDVLTTLSKVDSELYNFVRAYESFTHCGHICIVFELLHMNLYDYLKHNQFQPLPLKHVRPVAQQVLTCLKKLRELGLVHADLKPENIMLVDPDRQPFRVKIIDFGSATSRSTSLSTTYLQSRYYRAPEVILGVPYDEAIDMWSLGCVLAELFLGWPLFPGATEYDQISYISQMLGDPPRALTKNIVKMSRFFRKDATSKKWILKPNSLVYFETGVCPKEPRKFIFTSVAAIGEASPQRNHTHVPPRDIAVSVAEQLDKMQFISLLEMLLTFDPCKRADPSCCLRHPFITMLHLGTHTALQCVREWIQCMQVCCQSRTSYSSQLLPPHQQSTTAAFRLPSFHYPLDSAAYLTQPILNVHSPWHTGPSACDYLSSTAVVAPSTLASSLVVAPSSHPSSVLVDTGYVSADSSPTAHAPLDCGKIDMFQQAPLLLPQNSMYWLMLQQSTYLLNQQRSRL